ncbi:MAG: glycoside hydrolase, partial [Pedosphaera parvula]|nr:glycoside hydrolase [Pedosphaera parvula]
MSLIRRREFLPHLLGLTGATLTIRSPSVHAADKTAGKTNFNVRTFGARGDGSHLDTQALQKAIDTCAQSGGGTILFPAGTYLSGTLFLKSRVALHLDSGAVLL